jgi:hypothetical protein
VEPLEVAQEARIEVAVEATATAARARIAHEL